MAVFNRLDRMVSSVVDRALNDGRFRLTPKAAAGSNSRGQPDGTRPTVEGPVIFEYLGKDYGIELGVRKTYREANDLRALSSGRDAIASIDRKHFASLDDEPRAGDKIEFLDMPALPAFQVVDVRRDGQSRMQLHLVHIGAQA